MDAKWERYKLNQLSGTYLMLDNLLHSQRELFSQPETELLTMAMNMLKEKSEELRGGSPGGG
ncbi:MAG: hypothetical protein ACM3NT_07540 [Methylocystaceae bacterium]